MTVMRSHNNYIPRVLRMTLYRWKHSRPSVTLSEEGVICYDKPPQNDPRRVELTIVALAQLSGKKCLHFLRVWECLSIQPFSVLPVTNKQFFAFKKEHQTLMRSRLRRFCSERCIAANADQKANYFYAAVCTLLSPQNFDVRGDDCNT